ncbi:Nonribosomal peptide synthetase 2 [Grifola frondosa]|uniref:Nonribosomal peptide synthetase 2 n=1 Tax=Grifola frondosa TaxID=5627 RepID=A0A1C7MG18_GRIFR|nr:Nonribosomal peptide synthetase 2 [Grifola frondosa]
MSIVPAPKDSIEGSPVVRDSDALAGHEQLLSGYRHHDFPHLSSRRFASDTLHTVSDSLRELLRHCSDGNAFISAVITAVARVVGAYCGCQDVLIGVYEEGDLLRPIRVSWDETESWEHVNNAALRALADEKWPRTTPAALRNILGISEKQSPYLALFSIPPLEYTTAHITAPLHVTIHAASSTVSVSASERISHPSQSELFLSQVSALCAHSLNNPHSAVAVLPNLAPYLTSAYEQLSPEQRAIVYGRVPSVKLATDHLGLQATSQPHAIAVRWYSDLSTDQPISSFTPNVITFGDLHRKANQMASWLRQVGLETGVAVAVSMKRDIWFHISLVAILRAGGYYVPIDPELPPERQAFIVRDSNARFVLSSSDLPCYDALGPSALDVSDLEVQATIDAQDSAELELDVVSPDDTAYLLYTSGTTGTPKGCILTHRGLSEATLGLASMCASVEIENCSEANYLSIASVAFDVHLAEIFVPLALGIPILSAPRSLLLEDLPYYIKKLRISHVGIVPSLIEATMGAIQEDEDAGHETTLRYIASGGEKMSDAILDKWASHPKVHLANFYGPSEVTIGCAARFMDRDTPRANIGHTFANVAAFVVDENMNILLRGGAGELVVEGPLVGRGYNGRPDLTEKSFLKFPRDGTDRWAYRTGDLVRMMPDATLEVIGRIDTQIKLRGVRIESEGISSILRNAALSSYTLDAMTILAKHPAIGLEQLVSFVAWDTSVPVSVRKGGIPALVDPPEGLLDQLKVACDRELASYMRPSHIIPLDYIPLSSNGKADAKVLAKVFVELRMNVLTSLMAGGSLRSASGEVFTDITETESKVVEIAKKYIKISVENLLPHANLFECGMDSMVMTQFAAELRRAFGTQISTSNIMKSPVIRDLATLLEDSEFPPLPHDMQYTQRFYSEHLEDVSGAYPGSRIEDILPPFPVQEGVLYRSVNAPYMYVQHVLLRCNPDVCVSKLREAWCTVVSRHAMLRAVFYFGRELVQVILHADDCPNQCREKIAPSDDDSDFREFFSSVEASLTATDINEHLSDRPPVRLSFYSTDSSRTTFVVLSIHHALYDGMSLPVLLRDFESAYLGEPALPSAP